MLSDHILLPPRQSPRPHAHQGLPEQRSERVPEVGARVQQQVQPEVCARIEGQSERLARVRRGAERAEAADQTTKRRAGRHVRTRLSRSVRRRQRQRRGSFCQDGHRPGKCGSDIGVVARRVEHVRTESQKYTDHTGRVRRTARGTVSVVSVQQQQKLKEIPSKL